MKAIARRFSAYTEEASRGKRLLRLLPRRWIATLKGQQRVRTDAPLFAGGWKRSRGDRVRGERREPGRRTSLEIWSGPCPAARRRPCSMNAKKSGGTKSSGKNPNDPRSGYLSVHGIATLPLEPPDRPADQP